MSDVHAMTDVTGFGLAGHLLEMCQGAGLTAMLDGASLPELPRGSSDYIQAGCVPGGSQRNFDAYGEHLAPMDRRHACAAVRSANQRRLAHSRRAERDSCGPIPPAIPRPRHQRYRCTTGERPNQGPLSTSVGMNRD